MHIKDVVGYLVGGAVIYVAGAACSGVSTGSLDGGAVSSAHAAEPEVVRVPCPAADAHWAVATHRLPGLSMADVTAVRVVFEHPEGDTAMPAGFRHSNEGGVAENRIPVPSTVYYADELVGASCEGGSTVVFIVPASGT